MAIVKAVWIWWWWYIDIVTYFGKLKQLGRAGFHMILLSNYDLQVQIPSKLEWGEGSPAFHKIIPNPPKQNLTPTESKN
jgi:hypothetical protein